MNGEATTSKAPADDVISPPTRRGTELDEPSAGRTLVRRRTNYGDAPQYEIWQVARAATAAPFYFKPMIIDHGSTQMSYTDGGLFTRNNPTSEGIQEVEEGFGIGSLDTVVSIGTAKALKPDGKTTISRGEQMIDRAGDPEQVHDQIQAQADKTYGYFRFNDTRGIDVDFDDCLPRKKWPRNRVSPGFLTYQKIETAWNEWASRIENFNALKRCAERLVEIRWARKGDEARWERFATCAEYRWGAPTPTKSFTHATTSGSTTRTAGMKEAMMT